MALGSFVIYLGFTFLFVKLSIEKLGRLRPGNKTSVVVRWCRQVMTISVRQRKPSL